jgi:AraC-like DNA-binding protein/uncharacterized membrane protein
MHALSFISLVGVVTTLLLALRLVIAPSENRAAATALAAFFGCCALYVLDDVFYREGWFARAPWFYAVANPFIAAISPCFFLYARAATTPCFRWRARHGLHVAPALLLGLMYLPVFLAPTAEKLQMAADDYNVERRLESVPSLIVLEAYFYSYLAAAWWCLWRARERVRLSQEEGRSHPLRGIRIFASAMLVLGVFTTVLDYTPWARLGTSVAVMAVVLLVFAVLWLSTQPAPFMVAREPAKAIVPPEAAALVEQADARLAVEAEIGPIADDSRRPVPQRTPDLERLGARVRQLLETERMFLTADLSLQDLAERAGTTRHKLSEVLKHEFGGTFYQVIAGYRVREAARVLATEDGAVRTIADIAFASGFNTLSAFNAAFRAVTGQTPSAYRRQVQEENAAGRGVPTAK